MENKLFLIILLLGFFLRIYKPAEFFMYSHDNDLSGWFVRDVVANRHLRLIGQETSTQGIFIGPLYYYLLIPFYLLFGMDPMGGVIMITLLGVFSIWSVYFVFLRVFGRNEGLVASFLFAISFYTIFNDRDVVPTMPVILWSIWYFYGINLLIKGKQNLGFLILGILIGLIWHLNVGLVLLVPLIPLSILLSKTKLNYKKTLRGLIAAGILSFPLILFEFRHNFSQASWLYKSFTTDQHALVTGYDKLIRTFHLLSKNADGLIWGSFQPFSYETTTALLLVLGVFLIYKRKLNKNLALIIFSWLILFVGFFSIYSKILSEYYLNGAALPWIVILTLSITKLISHTNTKKYGFIILGIFAIVNLHQFFTHNVNKSGYKYRKSVVAEIKRDAEEKNFPCVSVSYITNPGYDLGYRYFFFLEEMHVNRPISGSPVYTIVFPLRRDIVEDKSFGHIGLIYPDYSRYTKEEVDKSCTGENSNLTDPMFGFTN